VNEGAYVFITGRREPELAAAVKEIGKNVTGVQGDTSNLGDLDQLFTQMSNSSSKGTALITGASRGIGAVYADRLAKRGYDLILVARSEKPLKALAASLSSASGRLITPIVADVNNKLDLAKVETKLKDDPSITLLVNNAGFASVAPLLDADIEKMEEMIALNIIGLTRLTYAAAPAFVKRGTGTIINIGSAAGISVEAMNGVYGASKAYVLAFSLSLQHELTSKGIRVQAVLPGRTATDGWEVAGLPWQQQPASIIMPVEDMVDAALVGLDQGELVTIPGLHNGDEWTRFETARRSMLPQFGTSVPAPRYRNQATVGITGSKAQAFAEPVRSISPD
jgi:short-subunit dehydrogenase